MQCVHLKVMRVSHAIFSSLHAKMSVCMWSKNMQQLTPKHVCTSTHVALLFLAQGVIVTVACAVHIHRQLILYLQFNKIHLLLGLFHEYIRM